MENLHGRQTTDFVTNNNNPQQQNTHSVADRNFSGLFRPYSKDGYSQWGIPCAPGCERDPCVKSETDYTAFKKIFNCRKFSQGDQLIIIFYFVVVIKFPLKVLY